MDERLSSNAAQRKPLGLLLDTARTIQILSGLVFGRLATTESGGFAIFPRGSGINFVKNPSKTY
jgi:hypothetical protein